MTRESFWHLHDLIKDNIVFVSNGNRQQRPVAEQLAAFLMHCGGISHVIAASHCCIAEGTTYLYHTRIRKALLAIQDNHLAWPGPQRRAFLKAEMSDFGFPGCIGLIDATLIPLAAKPAKDGWAYYTRKKCYAVRLHYAYIFNANYSTACCTDNL